MESSFSTPVYETDSAGEYVGPYTVAREEVFEGGVVQVNVPRSVRTGVCATPEGDIHFVRFSFGFRGGRVDAFVHTEDHSCIGKKVRGTFKLMRRVLSNGASYLYIDIIPVTADTPLTHRVVVQEGAVKPQPDWRIFKTPRPLDGSVVLMPAGATLSEQHRREKPAEAFSDPTVQQRELTPIRLVGAPKSDDPQLDRLLADGWMIDQEYSTEIDLIKYKDGRPKRMTHHRPKQKGGKRK